MYPRRGTSATPEIGPKLRGLAKGEKLKKIAEAKASVEKRYPQLIKFQKRVDRKQAEILDLDGCGARLYAVCVETRLRSAALAALSTSCD